MSPIKWNWEREDWPHFRYKAAELEKLEANFLLQAGVVSGAIRHINEEEKSLLTVELISNEALKTSEIEGEVLNRESLQSTIRRHFGLAADNRRISPAEQGLAEMMSDLFYNFAAPLTHEILFGWHAMLMSGRRNLQDSGRYRTGRDPMQIVSGPLHEPKVHFEAPPSQALAKEMEQFVGWFNRSAPDGNRPLPALTRAGIAHLYFVSIHPFEDGNGRIGRAISEKSLSQSLNQPTLIALSHVINSRKKAYYNSLEQSNRHNEITGWLVDFARTILDAQSYTQRRIDRLIEKAKFFDRFRGQFNERQEKAISRMFRGEPEGFPGGLSAEKYIRITGAARATATRDLQDLAAKGALTRTGTLKGTRYHLATLPTG
ncbi:MAG TPA: Fic family protein [Chthoniobacterales bacterium]